MTAVHKDFEAIYRTPTKAGWKWTTQEIFNPYAMRVWIDATARDEWNITKIELSDFGPVKDPKTNRYPVIMVELEGACFDEAVEFLRSSEILWPDLQDKVNQEILPEKGGWPYETFVGGNIS